MYSVNNSNGINDLPVNYVVWCSWEFKVQSCNFIQSKGGGGLSGRQYIYGISICGIVIIPLSVSMYSQSFSVLQIHLPCYNSVISPAWQYFVHSFILFSIHCTYMNCTILYVSFMSSYCVHMCVCGLGLKFPISELCY